MCLTTRHSLSVVSFTFLSIFYFLTIAKYVLQDGSITDSCYLCISLRENTNRTGSQRSVFYLDEGTWFVYIKSFHFLLRSFTNKMNIGSRINICIYVCVCVCVCVCVDTLVLGDVDLCIHVYVYLLFSFYISSCDFLF